MKYLDKIKIFDEKNLLSLDEIVMGALELFSEIIPPKIDINSFKKPLIFGSGNAIETAKIIFNSKNAIFCDSTNFDEMIKKDIDSVIIASASGEKHASKFTKKSLENGFKTILITCNNNSSSSKLLPKENIILTPKNREPYTYNTSTYLGWFLAFSGEEAIDIKIFIETKIDPILEKVDFSKYDSYLMVTPDKLSKMNSMFTIKFIELFGRKIARDVYSYEPLKHAIALIPHDKELCISFGEGDLLYKGNHINFPLPKNANNGSMMAIGYYVIGKIQNSYPQYFKENIGEYVKFINKVSFGNNIKVIVE